MFLVWDVLYYNKAMKPNQLVLHCKRILAGLCMIAEAIVLSDVFDDLLFELRYLGEWGYNYLLKDIFLLGAGAVILYFLFNVILDSSRQLSAEQNMYFHEERARVRMDTLRSQREKEPQEEAEEDLSVEELQEMLQSDYAEQKRNARM